MLSQHEFNIKNKDFIPLRALLRVDPCSQIYSFSDDSRLVTEKDFWEGEEGGKGLYLEYQNINGREISIFLANPVNYHHQMNLNIQEYL